jgi:hypothetical protein
MNNDYENYELEEECELKPEFNVFQRTEIFQEQHPYLKKGDKDKTSRFITFVNIVAKEIQSQELLNITSDDIEMLNNLILQIPSPSYKNPTAFILGYWFFKRSNGALGFFGALPKGEDGYEEPGGGGAEGTAIGPGREAPMHVWKKILNILDKTPYPVKAHDVIRYARMISTIKREAPVGAPEGAGVVP